MPCAAPPCAARALAPPTPLRTTICTVPARPGLPCHTPPQTLRRQKTTRGDALNPYVAAVRSLGARTTGDDDDDDDDAPLNSEPRLANGKKKRDKKYKDRKEEEFEKGVEKEGETEWKDSVFLSRRREKLGSEMSIEAVRSCIWSGRSRT